jgi:hypothetical protein
MRGIDEIEERPGGQRKVPFLPASLAAVTCIMEIEAASGEGKARIFWGFTIG